MSIKKTANNVVNYLVSVGIALFFALTLDGRVGWFMVLVLLLAPVISLIITLCVVRFTNLNIEITDNTVNKGDNCYINLNIKNRCFFPSPPLWVEIEDSPSVYCTGEEKLCIWTLPYGEERINVELRAEICGKSYIGIRSVKMMDYLGLFSFKAPFKQSARGGYISVIPDIEEIDENNVLINEITVASVLADDSEDTAEGNRFTFGGFPGYDNREYIPGDPLKRINWKLSAKRNKLLIRLEDEVVTSKIAIVLDNSFPNEFLQGREKALMVQKTIENALGFAQRLIIMGYDISFWVKNEENWLKYDLGNEAQLTELRINLADFTFTGNEVSIPEDELLFRKINTVLLCTPYADKAIKDKFSAYKGGKNQLSLILFFAMGEEDRL